MSLEKVLESFKENIESQKDEIDKLYDFINKEEKNQFKQSNIEK